jgi:hypothetical protein
MLTSSSEFVRTWCPFEGKDRRRHDLKDVRGTLDRGMRQRNTGVDELSLADDEPPVWSVLGLIGIGKALKVGIVGDSQRPALENQVKAFGHAVVPGRDNAVRVMHEVASLLLVRARAEVERIIQPQPKQGRHVRTAIGTNR